jgi:LysR family nitrogen assimilation transcriptional regulator
MLAGGQIDIAVLADAPNSSTLMSQRVVDEQLYLVSRDRSYVDDLGSTTVLVPGSARSVAKLCEHPMLRDARLVPLDCLGAAVDMIRRGQGSVVLPSSYVRRMSEAQFVPGIFVDDLSIGRSLSLTTSTQRPFTPAFKVISDQVVRMLKKAAAPKVDLKNMFAFGEGGEHTEAA